MRSVRADDLPALVRLLDDDPISAGREQTSEPLPPSYADALAAIDADPRNELFVVTEPDGRIVATLQLTYIPGISRNGSQRALVEAVHVASALTGQGIGTELMKWAIDRARARGCRMVQLTSNKSRADAHRFYEALGFVRTHEGFKLQL
jgi:GNAT superfamily N-acetyltransferase